MGEDLTLLLWTAASIALIHTILGPDHYIPFVAMARAGRWSKPKVLAITFLCGIGHVGGSLVLGLLGVGLGWTLGGMKLVESVRGEWAAWVLIAFGILYGVWGVKRAVKSRRHTHSHGHADGTVHSHHHIHVKAHTHVHADPDSPSMTPWILFTVFVLGPCEPLIPLLFMPAVAHSWWGLMMLTAVFGIVTISAMLVVVFVLVSGLARLPLGRLERWSHALAGFAIFASGAAIHWLGL